MKHKKSLLFILLLIAVVVMTGCVKVSYEVALNKDGSGTITIISAVEEQEGMDKSEGVEISVGYPDTEDAAVYADLGFAVEEYNEDNYIGIKATKRFESLEEFQKLNEEMNRDAENETIVFDSISIHEENGKMIVQGKVITSEEEELNGMEANFANNFIDVTISVKPEGEVINHNASKITSDGAYVWDIKIGEDVDIYLEMQADNGESAGSKGFLLPAIIIFALIVTIIAVAVIAKKTSGKN